MGIIRASAWVELKRIAQEKPRLLLLLAPLLAFSVCLLVYSARVVRELPVGLVDYDMSTQSRNLMRSLDATPQMKIASFPDEASLRKAFQQGRIRAGVLIPEGTGRTVREGGSAHVVIWRDASNPITSTQMYTATATVVGQETARLEVGRLMLAGVPYQQALDLSLILRTDSRPLNNPFFDYLRNMAPGLFAMFVQMGLMLAGGNLLPRHWTGSRCPRRELLGRAIPWMLVFGVIGCAFYSWFIPALGGSIPHPFKTSVLMLLLTAASLACGAAVGKFLESSVQTAQILLAFNTPAFVISGYSFPEWAMPALVESITRFFPFSFFMDAYRDVVGDLSTRALMGWLGVVAYLVIPLILLLVRGRKFTPPTPVSMRMGELIRTIREPGLMLLVLIAPISYMVLYGYIYMVKEEREIPLAVVGYWNTAETRTLVRSLDAHSRIRVVMADASDARSMLEQGDVRGILTIPSDYNERLRLRRSILLPVMVPANRFLPVSDLQRAVTDVTSALSSEMRVDVFMSRGVNPQAARERSEPLVLEDRALFNPGETYGDFILPGLGVLIMHQLLFVSIAFATGSAARRAKEIADLGKLKRRGILYVMWFSFWILVWMRVGLSCLSVPGQFHLVSALALAIPGLLAAAGLGIAVGLFLRGGQVVMQLLAFSTYPFFFLSGMSWPREAFMPWLNHLGDLIPYRPLATGLGRSFRMDANLCDLRPEIIHLWILAFAYAILACIAYWMTRRRLSR